MANNFELRLDTLAPSGSIARSGQYIKENVNLPITTGDASFAKFWFNSSATGTASDTEAADAEWTPLTAGTVSYMSQFTTEGRYYYHMQLMDSVNNKSQVYNTEEIVFDNQVPHITSASIQDPNPGGNPNPTLITNELQNRVQFAFSDSLSGVASYRLSSADFAQDITGSVSSDVTSVDLLVDFKSGTADGQKTVSIVVIDKAGNESAPYSVSITLKTSASAAAISLTDMNDDPLNKAINFLKIKAVITSDDPASITGYKAWVGDATEPSTFGSSNTIELTLPAGDGRKIIHAKIIDTAGNITVLEDASVLLDTTAPVVSVTADKSVISAVSGYNSATLTFKITEPVPASGIASFELSDDKAGSLASYSYTVTSLSVSTAKLVSEGQHTLTVTVTDKAGNVGTASCTILVDKTAPTARFTVLPSTWYNKSTISSFTTRVTFSDIGAGVACVGAWWSTGATDTVAPDKIIMKSQAPAANTCDLTYTDIDFTALVDSASLYLHVKVVDAVGNFTIIHAPFGYDTTPPAVTEFSYQYGIYNNKSATLEIAATDATSGVTKMKISGSGIANPTDGWEAFAATRTVVLTEPDGMKEATIVVQDAAGNISASMSASVELDRSNPNVTLYLRKPGETTPKGTISNIADVDVYFHVTDDEVGEMASAWIWGDITASNPPSDNNVEPTVTFDLVDGKADVTHRVTVTPGDGPKTIHVMVIDMAGNSAQTSATFILDTTPPIVEYKALNYSNISTVNELRRSGSAFTTDYSDEVKFTFFISDGGDASAEKYTAYKVCAYPTYGAMEGVDAATQTPIPTAGGSLNMSYEGAAISGEVNAMIKGTDLKTALGSDSGDGIKYIQLFMRDEAGTWSKSVQLPG